VFGGSEPSSNRFHEIEDVFIEPCGLHGDAIQSSGHLVVPGGQVFYPICQVSPVRVERAARTPCPGVSLSNSQDHPTATRLDCPEGGPGLLVAVGHFPEGRRITGQASRITQAAGRYQEIRQRNRQCLQGGGP
jgi:hypothetical protein